MQTKSLSCTLSLSLLAACLVAENKSKAVKRVILNVVVLFGFFFFFPQILSNQTASRTRLVRFLWFPLYGVFRSSLMGITLCWKMQTDFEFNCIEPIAFFLDLEFCCRGMEKEAKSQRGLTNNSAAEDFGLQWGNRKRLRCVKVKDQSLANISDCLGKKKITSRVDRRVVGTAEKDSVSPLAHRLNKNSDSPMNHRKAMVSSPEKEDRYYTTRGSLGLDENGKVLMDHAKEDRGHVWPKLFITLSSKEKEDDFLAMKGCKLPQRPKKRAKLIQKSLLLVSPGAWLSDLCQERYEVREKKASKKKPRGLKAMGSMESDSE